MIMIHEEEDLRSATQYSPEHDQLVVGDGDLSFSLSLALTFGCGDNIVATYLEDKRNKSLQIHFPICLFRFLSNLLSGSLHAELVRYASLFISCGIGFGFRVPVTTFPLLILFGRSSTLFFTSPLILFPSIKIDSTVHHSFNYVHS
ncbi:hypothetical protein LINGRAHAP2_LOCUS9561, partial [Linum grandiflorum]